MTLTFCHVDKTITSPVVIWPLTEEIVTHWWPLGHTTHPWKEFITESHSCRALKLWKSRCNELNVTAQEHPSHTNPLSLFDINTLICQAVHIFPTLSHTALLHGSPLLASFNIWLSRLVCDWRHSIIALYHHLYPWRFAWLYVFLMATLGEIEWNDIWNPGRQGDLFCCEPSFIHVTAVLEVPDDASGALNAFLALGYIIRLSAKSMAIMDCCNFNTLY